MRPIDADELKKRLPTFAEVIDEEPTIEAEPVRHGRWRESDNKITCTACGAEFSDELPWATFGYVEFHKAFAYCPTCGAKMDGGEIK